MESRNIVILFSLLLIAEIPIKGQSVQSLAPGYFGSPTRSTSENLGIKRYVKPDPLLHCLFGGTPLPRALSRRKQLPAIDSTIEYVIPTVLHSDAQGTTH